MNYTIKKNIHNDFKIFEINKLPPRAYAIPYDSAATLKKTELKEERYSSDMTLCLSGDWDFKFYKSISKLPDTLCSVRTKFDSVHVPSVWQREGRYEEPVYLNCPYQFKTFEPDIPEDMPVGVYRKKFNLTKTAGNYIITFLGVANNLSLYVNGEFVGYSEGSHNTAEFNVTSLLKDGENEILCVLFKWCNGSFLEAQDMFRDNGIFRDVLLTAYPEKFLYDYQVNTRKEEDKWFLDVDVFAWNDEEITVKGTLVTVGGRTIAKAEGKDKLDFGEVNVKEWNAEIPTVYYLYLTAFDGKKELMTVRNVTGFRDIDIEGNRFLFNGMPIKFIGVNHHDTDLYKGYAMSLDDMERDVRLMKEFNANAVRTSHYPPDPFFLVMCDVYGLYVVDEADIETHGCSEMAGDAGYISKQKKWITHYVDRVKRMYFRDRSHPSITMWSLGNESGGYTCHDECYAFIKEQGSIIPVHYEGVVRTKRFHYDVISEMYTNTYAIDEMIKGVRKFELDGKYYPSLAKDYNNYPFFLCEYCHAMGVGPGNLDEYVDRFFNWEGSMGGCIWEWADHTVYHGPDDKKYKYKYTYGGDHGEKQHDGHFCVDALMYSDRRPHTGAKEMRVAYRPLRVKKYENGAFTFMNVNRFRASDYIKTEWTLLKNGVPVQSGSLDLKLAPTEEKEITLDLNVDKGVSDYYINFVYTDKNDGREIAQEQVCICSGFPDCSFFPENKSGDFTVKKEADTLKITFADGEVTFAGERNDLVSYIYKGKEYLCATPEKPGFNLNVARAWIDNDARNRDKWRKAGLEKLDVVLAASFNSIENACVCVTNSYDVYNGKKCVYEVEATYEIYPDGKIMSDWMINAVSAKAETDLPRFGCTFELTGDFEEVRYYGRGPAENMPDFYIHAPVGIYEDTVTNMFEPYVFPQESGMHCGTRWFELKAPDGRKLTVKGLSALGFSVHHFTQNELNKACHQEDIVNRDTTFVTVDGYDRGIGSSSCGPDTRHEYIDADLEHHAFCFMLIPSEE